MTPVFQLNIPSLRRRSVRQAQPPRQIPPELTEIILHFCSHPTKSSNFIRDLKSFSLVSCAWRDEAQRLLFRLPAPRSYHSAELLLRAVSSSPRLAAYVTAISTPGIRFPSYQARQDFERETWRAQPALVAEKWSITLSIQEWTRMISVFEELWRLCPNVTKAVMYSHKLIVPSSSTSSSRFDSLTHLVLKPSSEWDNIDYTCSSSSTTDLHLTLCFPRVTRLTLSSFHIVSNIDSICFITSTISFPSLNRLDIVSFRGSTHPPTRRFHEYMFRFFSRIGSNIRTLSLIDWSGAWSVGSFMITEATNRYLNRLVHLISDRRITWDIRRVDPNFVPSFAHLKTLSLFLGHLLRPIDPRVTFPELTRLIVLAPLTLSKQLRIHENAALSALAHFLGSKSNRSPLLSQFSLSLKIPPNRRRRSLLPTVLAFCFARRCEEYGIDSDVCLHFTGSIPSTPYPFTYLSSEQSWTHHKRSYPRLVHDALALPVRKLNINAGRAEGDGSVEPC